MGPSVSYAQDEPVAVLDYQASEGCLDEGRFRDEVAARVGRVPFVEESPARIVVRAAGTGQEFIVTFELIREGSVSTTQTRTIRHARCSDALEAAAAAIAVWLEPPSEGGGISALMGSSLGETAPPPELVDEPSDDDRIEVHFSSDIESRSEQGWYLHVETGTVQGARSVVEDRRFYERFCLLPCSRRMPRGSYQFALARGNQVARLQADNVAELLSDADVLVTQRRPNALHRTGAAFSTLGFLASVVGIPMWIAAARRDNSNVRLAGAVMTLAGLPLFVGGTVMVRFGDRGGVRLHVSPRSPTESPAP